MLGNGYVMNFHLQIATGSHNEDSVAEEHEDIEMVQGDQISGNQLFFIDSSGGLQDIEQNEVSCF